MLLPPKFLETPKDAPLPNEIPNELLEKLVPETVVEVLEYEIAPKAKFKANPLFTLIEIAGHTLAANPLAEGSGDGKLVLVKPRSSCP